MGSVYPGAPREFTRFLQERYAISNFVETGTNLGATALWAGSFFERVYTIELSEKLYLRAKKEVAMPPTSLFIKVKALMFCERSCLQYTNRPCFGLTHTGLRGRLPAKIWNALLLKKCA